MAALTVVGAIYLGSIPLTVRAASRQRREYEARQMQPPEPRPTDIAAPATVAPAALGEATPPPSEWRH